VGSDGWQASPKLVGRPLRLREDSEPKGESYLVEVHRVVSGKPEEKLTVTAEVTGNKQTMVLREPPLSE
jgi:hypothetical protein